MIRDNNLHAAVLLAAGRICIRSNGEILAIAGGSNARRGNASFHQRVADGLGAQSQAEALVVERIGEGVFAVLSPEASVKSRTSFGGTAPAQVRKRVEAARKALGMKA